MGTPMKSTIDIADTLLAQAKQAAAREGTTLRALVEAGLRQVLRERRARQAPFALRRTSFKGKGLCSDLQDQPWEQIRKVAYENHGA